MKLDTILPKLMPLVRLISRFKYLLGGLVIIGLFAYTVLVINRQLALDTSDDIYRQKVSEIKKIDFDEAAIERIKNLQDIDVNIGSQLPDNRNNPF